ncbi:MAG TPA: nucleotide pyrophosphohydrolase [Erysipelotrichaceae bacterium]|nr:nucleotide pyrophosphohydrolase [Erysipelotrichaceae bacterium]
MNEITEKILAMRSRYGWEKSDTPRILAKSIMVEAGELLQETINEPMNRQAVLDEIADVLMYAISMCNDLGEDYQKVIEAKIVKVHQKYGK